MEASHQHEHVIRFSVDDEPVETTERKLSPRTILTLAGIDVDNHYLVRIDGRAQHSFKDDPDTPIEVHDGEKFISVATGPTPVSQVAAQDFIAQLRDLGFDAVDAPIAQIPGQTIVRLPYTIPLGSKAGEEIMLAFLVPPDFNLTCPSGPYMHPYVLPVNQLSEPPYGGVSDASQLFGADWQYWSRPYSGWATSDRNGRDYMRHIAHLFDLI